jgi:hypothetical protein
MECNKSHGDLGRISRCDRDSVPTLRRSVAMAMIADEEEVYGFARRFGIWCAAVGGCLLVWWVVIEWLGRPVVKVLSEL